MPKQKEAVLSHSFTTQQDLTSAYMPFIVNGGIFIKQDTMIPLNKMLNIHLEFAWLKESLEMQGKVVWWTPLHALHHAVPGIGVQIVGDNLKAVKEKIESLLDTSQEMGSYTALVSESLKAL